MGRISCLFILFLTLIFLLPLNAYSQFMNLSITSLVIENIERVLLQDDFFDIIDTGDYILLPLSTLAWHLNLQLTYHREEEWLHIKSQRTKKEVTIDLKRTIYLEHPAWSNYPPVIAEGDFFVTPLLLEYLLNVQVDWNPRRQTVTIFVDWDKEEAKPKEVLPGIEEEEKERIPSVIGSTFSLGSIKYRIIHEKRRYPDGSFYSAIMNRASLHGRAGDWAISLGVQGDIYYEIKGGEVFPPLFNQDYSLALPFFQGLYRENNRLIIVGDSTIHLTNIMGRRDIRGFYYQYPQYLKSHLLAFTSVKGEANPGDRVNLYVNQIHYGEVQVGEDLTYHFMEIPLRMKRKNQIRLYIETPKGEMEVKEKTLVASPRILEEGRAEYKFMLGEYRRPEERLFEGELLGFSIKRALSPYQSLTWEFLTRKPYHLQETEIIEAGSFLGLAYQSKGQKVMSLDWLVGGKIEEDQEEEIKSGVFCAMLYGLEKGHFELKYQFFPQELRSIFPGKVGEGFEAIGEWDISPNYRLWIKGDTLKIPSHDPPSEEEGILLSLIKRDGFRRETGLTLVYRKRSIALEASPLTIKEEGIILQDSWDTISHNTRLKLSYLDLLYYYEHGESLKGEEYAFKGSLAKRFTSSILGSTSLETSYRVFEKKTPEGKGKGDLLLRINPFQGNYLTFSLEGEGKIFNEDSFLLEESRRKITLRQHFGHSFSLSLAGTEIRREELQEEYLRSDLKGSYHFPDGKGSLSLQIGYISPVGTRPIPQWTAGFEYRRNLEYNIELGIGVKRLYGSIFDTKHQDLFTISLSQAIGFAREGYLFQEHGRENVHTPYIGGKVFLDENGNGVYDEGEPLLPGIKMALDGRRRTTSDDGHFIFEHTWPGIYEVGFDMRSLDADYSVVTREKMVQIKENENIFLSFGLTLNGAISGIVYLDEKAKGVREPEYKPVPWVGLKLLGTGKVVYSRSDGRFFLEGIPLGEYQLEVLLDSLPGGTEVLGDRIIPVEITPDSLYIQDLEFPLIYQRLN